METIQEARDFVFDEDNFHGKGVFCPCCDQNVKAYRLKIDSIQARALIVLVMMYRKDPRFYHINEIKKRVDIGNWMAKLKFWGLIEDDYNKFDGKRKSGLWKPTAMGMLFVDRSIRVHRYCRFYNGTNLGLYGDMVDIIDCLNQKFNYRELMNT